MHRYQILIEYEGTKSIGWQIQPQGRSIQKTIQNKISKILKQKITLIGAGRTDSGVHAIEQSAHFNCKKKIENLDKFIQSLNYFLNLNLISIVKIKKRSLNFHSRFSAKLTGCRGLADTTTKKVGKQECSEKKRYLNFFKYLENKGI